MLQQFFAIFMTVLNLLVSYATFHTTENSLECIVQYILKYLCVISIEDSLPTPLLFIMPLLRIPSIFFFPNWNTYSKKHHNALN